MLTHIPCAGQWHWRGSHFGLDRANAISSKKGVAAIRLYHKVQTRAAAKRPSAWIESLTHDSRSLLYEIFKTS